MSTDKPVADALQSAAAEMSGTAEAARQKLSEDMDRLRADVASLRDTLAQLVAASGGEAASAAGKVRDAVKSQIEAAAAGAVDASAEMASQAKEQVKTFASELEGMAKRQPLGSLAGALVVGIVIGLLSRGRN